MEWTNVGKSSSNSYRLTSTSKFDLNTHLFGLSAHLSPQNSSGLVWAECLSYLTNGEFRQCSRNGASPPSGVSVSGFSGAHHQTPERGLAVDATNSNQFGVLARKLSSGQPSSIFLNRRCKCNIWVDSVMSLTTLCSTCTT